MGLSFLYLFDNLSLSEDKKQYGTQRPLLLNSEGFGCLASAEQKQITSRRQTYRSYFSPVCKWLLK
jgi:hypothetical protein